MSCSNMLKCNPKKTKIIHCSSLYSPAEPVPSIKVGDCSISLSNEVKDLGVTLDRHLTFKTHINNICSASSCIHHIGKIRNRLYIKIYYGTPYSGICLFKTGSCKSILHGLPSYELEEITTVAKFFRKANC